MSHYQLVVENIMAMIRSTFGTYTKTHKRTDSFYCLIIGNWTIFFTGKAKLVTFFNERCSQIERSEVICISAGIHSKEGEVKQANYMYRTELTIQLTLQEEVGSQFQCDVWKFMASLFCQAYESQIMRQKDIMRQQDIYVQEIKL